MESSHARRFDRQASASLRRCFSRALAVGSNAFEPRVDAVDVGGASVPVRLKCAHSAVAAIERSPRLRSSQHQRSIFGACVRATRAVGGWRVLPDRGREPFECVAFGMTDELHGGTLRRVDDAIHRDAHPLPDRRG